MKRKELLAKSYSVNVDPNWSPVGEAYNGFMAGWERCKAHLLSKVQIDKEYVDVYDILNAGEEELDEV